MDEEEIAEGFSCKLKIEWVGNQVYKGIVGDAFTNFVKVSDSKWIRKSIYGNLAGFYRKFSRLNEVI